MHAWSCRKVCSHVLAFVYAFAREPNCSRNGLQLVEYSHCGKRDAKDTCQPLRPQKPKATKGQKYVVALRSKTIDSSWKTKLVTNGWLGSFIVTFLMSKMRPHDLCREERQCWRTTSLQGCIHQHKVASSLHRNSVMFRLCWSCGMKARLPRHRCFCLHIKVPQEGRTIPSYFDRLANLRSLTWTPQTIPNKLDPRLRIYPVVLPCERIQESFEGHRAGVSGSQREKRCTLSAQTACRHRWTGLLLAYCLTAILRASWLKLLGGSTIERDCEKLSWSFERDRHSQPDKGELYSLF